MNNNKKCFVIMPFSQTYKLSKEKWTEIFTEKIKTAIEESGLGYECKRYELRRANITKDILQELSSAPVVIADLTGSNPNVLWELGVRHTLSKPTILIAQDKKFLPSDLKDYPIITYKYIQTPAEVNEFKRDIKDKLKDIESDPDKPDSPVADFLTERNIDLLSAEKKAKLAQLAALVSEISYNIGKIDFILKQLKEVQRERKKVKIGPRATPTRLSKECFELLVTTQYIVLPKELSEVIKQANSTIGALNRILDMWWHAGKQVEKRLFDVLPEIRKDSVDLLRRMNKVRIDYVNDNYIEPQTPAILLSSQKHEKYLKLTEKAT